MKFRTEYKIGIIVLSTILLVIWGINYLKGENVLKRSDVYHAVFEDIKGMDASGSVYLNGLKIGMINTIRFQNNSLDKLVVAFAVDHKYKLPEGTVVALHSSDLLGTKALKILPSDSEKYHEYGDTLISTVEKDMISELKNEFLPLKDIIENSVLTLDSVLSGFNSAFDEETRQNLSSSIRNLESVSSDLSDKLSDNGDLGKTFGNLAKLSSTLSENRDKLEAAINNFDAISDSVAKANIAETIENVNKTFVQTEILLENINKGKGSAGLLVTNDSLYVNLENATKSLDVLLKDLNENPKKYVHFSIFGRKNK